MSNLESIKDKISKLLAKAEGTENAHEAEAFMAKVNALLEEHQVNMHDLGATGDPIGHQWGENHIPSSLAWYYKVCSAIATYYGAKFLFYKYKNGRVPYVLIGPESSRITAELMMPYIISQVRQNARVYMREQNDLCGYRYLTEVKAQTHVGLALLDRISNLIRANKAHRDELVKNALVPVDMNESYAAATFKKPKIARQSTGHTTADARKYAENISLHHQTTNVKSKMIEGS